MEKYGLHSISNQNFSHKMKLSDSINQFFLDQIQPYFTVSARKKGEKSVFTNFINDRLWILYIFLLLFLFRYFPYSLLRKNHCQLRIKNAVNLDLFVFTHNHLMGFVLGYLFKNIVLSKLNIIFWIAQSFDIIERLQI